MINIIPISGVVELPRWRRYLERISDFWSKPILYTQIPYNRNARMIRYDQGKTKECTIYASCGALCNNTEIDMTQLEVEELAKHFVTGGGLPLYPTAKKIAEMHSKQSAIFHTFDDKVDVLLKKGYELVVSMMASKELFIDGVGDGVINHYQKGDMNHAIRLKWTKEKGYFLVNSWAGYLKQGLYNEFEIDMKKAIKNKLFRMYILII